MSAPARSLQWQLPQQVPPWAVASTVAASTGTGVAGLGNGIAQFLRVGFGGFDHHEVAGEVDRDLGAPGRRTQAFVIVRRSGRRSCR